MSTPPTINDPTDRPPHDGDGADGDWARWEQTFRDARPVLPDVAMERIESTIRREADRSPEPTSRAGRWVLFVACLLLAVCFAGVWLAAHRAGWGHPRPSRDGAGGMAVAPRVRDRYALEVPIGTRPYASQRPASGPATPPQAMVEATAKFTQEGVTTYAGPVTLTAGPRRLACDRLTVFRNPTGGVLLSAAGHVRLTGVPALQSATADEATLNTATGELKLAGKVRLERDGASQDADSLSITRTGDVHLPQH